MDLGARFAAHLDRTGLLAGPGMAVVAVSGGPDSVALLDLLAGVAVERQLGLRVAHADHGIQPHSRTVAAAVRRLAGRYGLPFELGELRLGPGTSETAARRARYRWLHEVQAGCGARWLVTAHHADDQIETVLLRVLRGSAPAGLAGIRPRGRGGLVRPLLPFARAELAGYCAARDLPVHHDPANRDPRHLRSWVRGVLLPLLRERLGSRVGADLRRLARHAGRDRRAWDGVLQLVPGLALRRHAMGFSVARGALAGYDEPVAVAVLRAAARRAGLLLGPDRARRVLVLTAGASGRRVALGGGWEAAAEFDRLVLRGSPAAPPDALTGTTRGRATFGAFRLEWAPAAAPPALARTAWTTWLAGPDWLVRPPAAGDRIAPLGGVGRRAVRRLLMEARVPQAARARWPVVVCGATVAWVPGICRGAAALPAPGTRAVRLDVIPIGDA